MTGVVPSPTKRRGIRLWCPHCQDISVCHAEKPEKFGLPRERRYEGEKYKDVQWFMRARVCDSCSRHFVTAEISEDLVLELLNLRDRVAVMQRPKVKRTLRERKWLGRNETIPLALAEDFIRASAWWLTHSSGYPVRARRHAERIERSSRHGWMVEFGANSFLVGKALERCRERTLVFFERIMTGDIPKRSEVETSFENAIAGSVANYHGEEYSLYPDRGAERELIFGAQAISLKDGSRFMFANTGIEDFLAPC